MYLRHCDTLVPRLVMFPALVTVFPVSENSMDSGVWTLVSTTTTTTTPASTTNIVLVK